MAHCRQKGDAAIIGHLSHINNWETGGPPYTNFSLTIVGDGVVDATFVNENDVSSLLHLMDHVSGVLVSRHLVPENFYVKLVVPCNSKLEIVSFQQSMDLRSVFLNGIIYSGILLHLHHLNFSNVGILEMF